MAVLRLSGPSILQEKKWKSHHNLYVDASFPQAGAQTKVGIKDRHNP